jgi:hypothetical protein
VLKSCRIRKRGFILVGSIHFEKVCHSVEYSVELQFREK